VKLKLRPFETARLEAREKGQLNGSEAEWERSETGKKKEREGRPTTLQYQSIPKGMGSKPHASMLEHNQTSAAERQALRSARCPVTRGS